MDQYLKSSARFEIFFALVVIFEVITSIIAGKLIISYSEDAKSNLRVDPITGLTVPSLVFVYNQQQIIDCMAGIKSETPE